MIVNAWNIGSHNRNGNGYGLKVKIADRDAFFNKEWDVILVEIEGEEQPVEIKINKDAFWSEKSQELVSTVLGKWMRKNGLAPWHQGNPPTIELDPIEENRFKILKPQKNHHPY
jgi:hypothetical protein